MDVIGSTDAVGWFLARIPGHARDLPAHAELAALLESTLETARDAWPDLVLEERIFVGHLAGHVPIEGEVTSFLADLFSADLYLACACALGHESALCSFESHYLARVSRNWSGSHPLSSLADEVTQQLRERLLLGRDGAPPRIATYAGRGPLAAWVQMVATRLALNLRKADRLYVPLDDRELATHVACDDPELDYLKTRYAVQVKEAFQSTLAALPARLANVVRLHYFEGVTVDAIGIMYRASGRTVQRWLAEARRTILADTRRLLREQLDLPESELDSLIRMVRSRLDISVLRYLRSAPDIRA